MVKIAFIGQPEYFRAFYEDDLNSSFTIFEFNFKFSMSFSDFEELIRFDADYNVFFRGEFVPDEVLHNLKGKKIAISSEPFPSYFNNSLNYTYDSYKRFECFLGIVSKNYDFVFHYDATSLRFLENFGLELSGVFEFPIATETYRPCACENKWDMFFIGRSTEYREKFLSPLKHYFNLLHISHGVHGSDLLPYLCGSKILLNLHAENEVSWEPRVQMLMATGGFVISHKLSHNNILVSGVDYVEADMNDPADLYRKVEFYLHNAGERERIAKNGYNKVIENLSAKSVFKQFFKNIENGVYPQFRKNQKILFHQHLKFFSYINKKIGFK